ncbi:MAG: DNA methyltransferase [Boseongicola sp.]
MNIVSPRSTKRADQLLDKIAEFDQFDQQTRAETRDGIPYFFNEFWTSAQRRSHALHEVSYRACFKAELPAFFIDRLSKPGNAVLDPFMGRGTTLLEAALRGRHVFGNDINPLSSLLIRPRLQPIDMENIAEALKSLDWSAGEIENEGLLAFYHPDTLRQINALRAWLAERAPIEQQNPDLVADWIRMVALGRLSGHSPGFFSGRSMPPNQAVSIASQKKINTRLGLTPPVRDVASLILKKSKSLLRQGSLANLVDHSLNIGLAWKIGLPEASIDLVVTSPPFLNIVDYAGDNWLRCWFAGIDPSSVAIDQHRTEAAWQAMIARVLAELARLLKPGGFVAFEVGEVRNQTVLLERLVWDAGEDLPFRRLGVMVNAQEFTKTANCWGVANGQKGTNTNRIVLFERL